MIRANQVKDRFANVWLSLPPPSRLLLTLGIISAAVGWFAFFGVAEDYISGDPLVRSGDPLVRADLRVMYFIQSLREPAFDSLMLFFTYLGNWQVIAVGSVCFTSLMIFSRQWWWLTTFAFSIAH